MFRLAIVALLFVSSFVDAKIFINRSNRVRNVDPGCCMQATFESVARHQGFRQATGLTRSTRSLPFNNWRRSNGERSHPCHVPFNKLSQTASRMKIPHKFFPVGSYNTSLIKEGLRTGRPAIVMVKPSRSELGHAYAVVGVSRNKVHLFDTNKVGRAYVSVPKNKFNKVWNGSSLLLGK